MAQGVQVFNSVGELRLEITDRLSRFVGQYYLSPWQDNSTRFVSVDGMTDDGYWLVTCPSPDYVTQVGNGGVTVWSTSVNFTGFTQVPITVYRT